MGHRGGDGATVCTACSGGVKELLGLKRKGKGSQNKREAGGAHKGLGKLRLWMD